MWVWTKPSDDIQPRTPQVKLGYKQKAGHRTFRRLRTALEDNGCIEEVLGTIGDGNKKPVICIRSGRLTLFPQILLAPLPSWFAVLHT